MKKIRIALKGNYDREKKTTVVASTCLYNHRIITKRSYLSAIKRMGLMEGDFPVLENGDSPAIIVKDKYDCDYAIIQ